MAYKFVLKSDEKGAYVLPHDPEGWEEIEFNITRGLEYHGLFYEQDAKLEFICKAGKEYIDELYDTYGVDTKINIEIFYSCNCTPPDDAPDYTIDYSDDYGSLVDDICEWEQVYEGKLDLSTIEILDSRTKANIIQSDFFAKFRNRLDSKVSMASTESIDGDTITALSPYDFNLHQYPLFLRSEWERVDDNIVETFIMYRIYAVSTANVSIQLPFVFKTDNSNGYGAEQTTDLVRRQDPYSNTYTISTVLLTDGAYEKKQADEDENFFVSVANSSNYSLSNAVITPVVWRGFGAGADRSLERIPMYSFSNYLFKNLDEFYDYNVKFKIRLKASIKFWPKFAPADGWAQFRITWLTGIDADDWDKFYFEKDGQVAGTFGYLHLSNFSIPTDNGIRFDEIDIDTEITVNIKRGFKFTILAQYENFNVRDTEQETEVEFEIFNVEHWSIISEYNNLFPATVGSAYNLHDVGNQVIKGITGVDRFYSEKLGTKINGYSDNSCDGFLALTTGLGLRGFDMQENSLTISMADYFKGIDNILCLGLGVERLGNDDYRIRIEERDYFYDKTVLLTFDNVPNIKRTIAKEYLFNQIFIGYETYELENFTGLDEPNTQREYSLQVYATENKLSLLSNFVAGQYSIELCRRKVFKNFPQEDSTWDENYFILATKRTVDINDVPTEMNKAEKSENFTLDKPLSIYNFSQAYNLRYSPNRNLLRFLSYLSSSIRTNANKYFKFLKGYLNYKAEVTQTDACTGNFNNNSLVENSDLSRDTIFDLVEPIYIPEYIEFEYPLSFTQFNQIRTEPQKSIEINDGFGTTYRGFIIDMKYKPTRGIASFKLLRQYIP